MTEGEEAIWKEIRRRLGEAIQAGLEVASESYRSKVTADQSPPTSDPGEYPHEDTGQGAENISWGMEKRGHDLVGRWGLMGENSPIPIFEGQDHKGGLHLQELVDNMGRLGMEVSFEEDLSKVRAAVKKAYKR